jgi:hypothetical protein
VVSDAGGAGGGARAGGAALHEGAAAEALLVLEDGHVLLADRAGVDAGALEAEGVKG